MSADRSESPARSEIQDAWRRAAISGLAPSSALDNLAVTDVDDGSPLLLAARPVLDFVAEQLDGTRYSVVLADRDARIVERRFGVPGLESGLDQIRAMPGIQYSEQHTGTNAIATVHELKRGLKVTGDEHFIEALKPFCCYGHPIINPLSRRLEGILDITGLVEDTNDLLAPFLITAAREIEQRLLLGARATQQYLLAAFQKASAQAHGPVLVIGEGVSLGNPAASAELGPQDHAVLRAMAGEHGADPRVGPLTLASGRAALVELTPVTGGGLGVLIRVSLLETERTVNSGRPPIAPRRGPLLVLATGEAGSGRTRWAMAQAGGDPLVLLDAADDVDWPRWSTELSRDGTTAVIENVQLLDPASITRLRRLLRNRTAGRVIATASAGMPTNSEQAALISMFDQTVALPALRDRAAELPAIATTMLAELDPETPRRLSSDLLELLLRQPWPGNLHELRQVLRQLVASSSFRTLAVDNLPASYRTVRPGRSRTPMEEAEYQAIVAALHVCGGNKVRTAKQLGISRATLYTKIKAFRLTA